MQFMKRLVFGFLVFMISVGVAWAGERGYQLVAGRDSKLCARVLEAFREDLDDRWRLRYQHEIFRQITWKPVELRRQGPRTRHCSRLDKALFDLDNDGQPDLVVKTTFCMKGSPSDSFYMFPADSTVREQANWQDLSPVLATPDKFERTGGAYPLTQHPVEETGVSRTTLTGVIRVQPFMLDGSTDVSLTNGRGEWTVIAQSIPRRRTLRGSLLSSCGSKVGNCLFRSYPLASRQVSRMALVVESPCSARAAELWGPPLKGRGDLWL